MKKLLSLIVLAGLMCWASGVWADDWITTGTNKIYYNNSNGKVGIGTDEPNYKLDINGNIGVWGFLRLGGSATSSYLGSSWPNIYRTDGSGSSYPHNQNGNLVLEPRSDVSSKDIVFGTGNSPQTRMVIKSDGKIGVGEQSPSAPFHVLSGTGNEGIYTPSSWTVGLFQRNSDSNYHARISVLAGTEQTAGIWLGDKDNEDNATIWVNNADNSLNLGNGLFNPRMTINSSGDVLIGQTSNGQDFKLAVDGTIGAKEVKVVANTADYVFEKDYQLRPLEEVESFIQKKKHLPGIPSAAEQKKQKHIGVSNMMGKHLEKIEELTLYMIEMKKVNTALQKQNQELQKRLERLEKKLSN